MLLVQSQTELDEQFARRLVLEEQAAHRQAMQPGPHSLYVNSGTPYVPRSGEYFPQQPIPGGGRGGGGVANGAAELQEQLSKLAESEFGFKQYL